MPQQPFGVQKPSPPISGLRAAAPGQEPIPEKWAMQPEPPTDDDDYVGRGLAMLGYGSMAATKGILGFFGVNDQTSEDPRSASGWNQAGQISGAVLPLAAGLPGMYSRLQQAVSKLPGSMKASSAMNALRKFAHPEEIEFTGVGKMLDGMGNQPVRQMDIANQAVNNEIRLGVTELGGPESMIGRGTANNPEFNHSPTTFDRYQMPGSIPGSYRETLIKMPTTADQQAQAGMRRAGYHPDEIADVPSAGAPPVYNSNHWPDHPNTLAFVRHNERTLPLTPEEFAQGYRERSVGRVLENVQSDWHQEGAQHGYGPPVPVDPEIKERLTFVLAERDHIEQQAYAAGVDPSQISQQYDALAQEYERLHRQLDAHQGADSVPDAPFKDGRWADLALKQQVLDVANRPDLEWLGIAPGSESVKRGESLSPTFMDQTLPTKLGKILAPFGGKMEQAPTGIVNTKTPDLRSFYDDRKATSTIYDPADQTSIEIGGKHLASVWPQTPAALRDGPGPTIRAQMHADELQDLMKSQRSTHEQVQLWLSRMSPEMKAAILKKGLPLLSLYAMMQWQQAPLNGLEGAAPTVP